MRRGEGRQEEVKEAGRALKRAIKKARMLMEISFPAPTPYDGEEGIPGLPGTAHQSITELVVQAAFRGTTRKKSPGPDSIGPLAICCVYDWDSSRIAALVRTHTRLGIHPRRWKTARGATIPKPDKNDYGLAKSYRVISLLNCLGKMVEKVAAIMVSAHCKATGCFHPVQYGCRTRRSAVDAVGVAIVQTQEA